MTSIRKQSSFPLKVIEWVPGRWWLVAVTGADGSYTPLHEGKGTTPDECKADCEAERTARDTP